VIIWEKQGQSCTAQYGLEIIIGFLLEGRWINLLNGFMVGLSTVR
jgi:hypothetical protein